MARKSRRKTESRSVTTRAGDVAVVERAIELVEGIPRWKYPDGMTERRGVHQKLKDNFRLIWADLETLQAEFIPEASGPGPPACPWESGSSGTPVTNLLGCYDLCPHSVAETLRALRAVRDGLAGKRVPHPFLPAAEKIERSQRAAANTAARSIADEQRRREHMTRQVSINVGGKRRVIGPLPGGGRGFLPVPEAKPDEAKESFVLYLGQNTRAELDGQTHPLTTEQARLLSALARAKGALVPPERQKKDSRSAEDPGHTIKAMPAPIRALIKGKRGTGGGRRLTRIPEIRELEMDR